MAISSDRWSGGALLVAAAAVAAGASRMPLGDLTNPGPGFFPFWCALALALLSAGLIFARADGSGAVAAKPPLGPAVRLIGALCVYAAALEPLGYALATAGLLAVFLYELRQPMRTAIALAVAVPVATYLLFAKALGVALPKGLLPF